MLKAEEVALNAIGDRLKLLAGQLHTQAGVAKPIAVETVIEDLETLTEQLRDMHEEAHPQD